MRFVFLGQPRRIRFCSFNHSDISPYSESMTCGRVDEPEEPDTRRNALRSLAGNARWSERSLRPVYALVQAASWPGQFGDAKTRILEVSSEPLSDIAGRFVQRIIEAGKA